MLVGSSVNSGVWQRLRVCNGKGCCMLCVALLVPVQQQVVRIDEPVRADGGEEPREVLVHACDVFPHHVFLLCHLRQVAEVLFNQV